MKTTFTTFTLIVILLSGCATTNTVNPAHKYNRNNPEPFEEMYARGGNDPLNIELPDITEKAVEEDINSYLDDLSADTWSEGDYSITFDETACFDGFCIFSLYATEVIDDLPEKSNKCIKYELLNRIDFTCKTAVYPNDIKYINGHIFISEDMLDRLDECVTGTSYDEDYWEVYGHKVDDWYLTGECTKDGKIVGEE